MSLTTHRPDLRVTWIRDDLAHDEARYRVEAFGKGARVFDVRISLMAKAQSTPSPEHTIAEWFRRNPMAEAGAVEKIPDHHFSPSYC
jgi:hypothetical protein